MRHIDHKFKRINMLLMQFITRAVGGGHTGKDMLRQTGYWLLMSLEQRLDIADLLFGMISNLFVSNKLQLGIFEVKLKHYG